MNDDLAYFGLAEAAELIRDKKLSQKSGLHLTPRWRKQDSNPRSLLGPE